jgi:hypothetical protein
MNESVQEIVTDLMQRQPCSGGFLPTSPAVRLPESEVGSAVSAFIWSVVGHVEDGKTGNCLRAECIAYSAAKNAPCALLRFAPQSYQTLVYVLMNMAARTSV